MRMGGKSEMKERNATLMDKISPDLLVAPHIVDKLVHLVAGKWQPDSSQQEQLIAHFIECSYCRTAFIVLLFAEQKYERSSGNLTASITELITCFVSIYHKIESWDHEYIGAYAEAIIAVGKEEADKRFSRLAEHIKGCRRCHSAVEDTLTFLKESESSG
jgi:hypothetical protein